MFISSLSFSHGSIAGRGENEGEKRSGKEESALRWTKEYAYFDCVAWRGDVYFACRQKRDGINETRKQFLQIHFFSRSDYKHLNP
jgi:hypothetical protein